MEPPGSTNPDKNTKTLNESFFSCGKMIVSILFYYRDPVPNKRINPCEISRTLQKSDRALLPSPTAPSDLEELSTTLGASLDTSSHIFTDLQNTYLHII